MLGSETGQTPRHCALRGVPWKVSEEGVRHWHVGLTCIRGSGPFEERCQIASPEQNATGSGTYQLHILSEGDPEMTSQNNHGSTLLHRERQGQPEIQ